MLVDVRDTQYTVVRTAAARLGWSVLEKDGVVGAAGAAAAAAGSGAGDGKGDGLCDIKWHDGVIKPTDITIVRNTGVRWNHHSGIEALCTKVSTHPAPHPLPLPIPSLRDRSVLCIPAIS
jgi:hypothetical protein